MRRVVPILAGALMLGLAPRADAQIRIGAYGGITSTSFNGDLPSGAEYTKRIGPALGALVEFPVAENVLISVQPAWVSRGTKLAVKVEDELQDSLSLGLSYASLPVLMKIETAGGKLFVNSGLDFALLLDATASPVDGDGEDEDIKDKFKDFDLAANFGVGGQFPIGRPRVTIEARYTQSLTNLSAVSVDIGADVLVPTRVRSSGFEFLAGIWIPLGGS